MADTHAPWFWSSHSLPTRFSVSSLHCLFHSPEKQEDRQTRKKKKVMESRGKSQHSAQAQGAALWPGPGHMDPVLCDAPSGRAGVPAAPEPAVPLAEHPQGPAWDALPLAPWLAPPLTFTAVLPTRWNIFWISNKIQSRLGHFYAWAFSIHLQKVLFWSFHPKNLQHWHILMIHKYLIFQKKNSPLHPI